jgi:hypothetical protein
MYSEVYSVNVFYQAELSREDNSPLVCREIPFHVILWNLKAKHHVSQKPTIKPHPEFVESSPRLLRYNTANISAASCHICTEAALLH